MLETEDVYYLIHSGYLMYYDKAAQDSGYVCPRPECEHEDKFINTSCSAYLNACCFPSLCIYEGKLWWVGYPSIRTLGIYRMDLDGTNRELLHEFDMEQKFCGSVCFYFHRGRLFWSSYYQRIIEGMAYSSAEFGYMGLDDFEQHLLCERLSFINPQPTIRFLGESAYLFISYDGIDPEKDTVPNDETDLDAYFEWLKTNYISKEIMRWDPSMSEPETIYLDDDDTDTWGYDGFYVSPEADIYFVEYEFEDPDY